MDDATALLISVSGRDHPGITTRLCAVLAAHGARLLDVEQVVIRDRLSLGFLVSPAGDDTALRAALRETAADVSVAVEFEHVAARTPGGDRRRGTRHVVTVLGQPLRPDALAGVTAAIARIGANIDRIVRLSRYPILSFELEVSGGQTATLRDAVTAAAAEHRVDVAVQPAGLYRRAKRLICFDVDSTLVAGEVIELLAAHVGRAAEVAAITAEAMAGTLDFATALRERVHLLAGCPEEALDQVRAALLLTPGARTLVRTLRRLGYTTAMVSGGFTQITDVLAAELGIDHTRANTLEIASGRLTGRLVGPIVDRRAKADALEEFAAVAGVPLSQTVAVGDGANDLDMLGRAGLGIAFNAKRVVREAADTTVNVPYLDAILFVLGITREDVEAADAEDPGFVAAVPPPVPEP